MELETLKKIIVEVLDVSPEEIDKDTSLTDDLGADSLEVCKILMGVEDVFDIELKAVDQRRIKTVGDAVKLISRELK